jgi:hypothetical protein
MDCKHTAWISTGVLLGTLSNPVLALSIDQLRISEVMVNPSKVTDSKGEWFELYNPTDDRLDLDGLRLFDNGSDSHFIDAPIWINPGDYLVFARNGDATTNGGIIVDYVYDHFILANSADEIFLNDLVGNTLRLSYGAGFAVAGQSRELLAGTMVSDNYSLTPLDFMFGGGDIGTPGFDRHSASLAATTMSEPGTHWLIAASLLALFSLDWWRLRQTNQSLMRAET